MDDSVGGAGLRVSALVASALVLLLAVPTAASGSRSPGTCDTSWVNPAGGDWFALANWSAGVPNAQSHACVTLSGTYAVEVAGTAAVKELVLGGSSGVQTVRVDANCSTNAVLGASSAGGGITIGTSGVVELTSSGCASSTVLDAGPNTIVNGGAIAGRPGAGGGRNVRAAVLENDGAVTADSVTLSFDGVAANWNNGGAVTLTNATLLLPGGQTLTNGTGGAIAATGTGRLTLVSSTLHDGVGTITGPNPVLLESSNLDVTGLDSASYLWHGTGTLIGGLTAQTQTLTIQATCSGSAVATHSGDMFNKGSIAMSSTGCPNDTQLNASGTLTNHGVLTGWQGAGGQRAVGADVVNPGLVQLFARLVAFQGTFTQPPAGKLRTATDALGRLGDMVVSGSASLAGELVITRDKAFNPPVGSTLHLITAASLSGTFEKLVGAVIKGSKYFDPTYSSTQVILEVKLATVNVSPSSGPGGTVVTVEGSEFPAGDTIILTFKDKANTKTAYPKVSTDQTGSFSTQITIPSNAAPGAGQITAKSKLVPNLTVKQTFTVTPLTL